MGKASVSNIKVPLGLVVAQKPGLWLVSRLWLACSRSFLYPPPGSVRLHCTATLHSLAGTLLLPVGWHPTATLPLAPYCYFPAGTLLLIVVSWHPLCPVAPLTHLPLSLLRFTLLSQTSLSLPLIMLLHCLLGLS